MDTTILAVLITAGLGLVGSWLAVRQVRHSEAEKAEIARNTNELAATKLVVEGLRDHMELTLTENRDLRAEVAACRVEVAFCRANHSQRRRSVSP